MKKKLKLKNYLEQDFKKQFESSKELSFMEKKMKMENKSRLQQMEELDARIEKINYDLSGLESRKKELEGNKFNKLEELNKLEKEKQKILYKTNNMNRFQKLIYIVVSSKTDMKQVALLNAKIEEVSKEEKYIQNKIDIQNKLYSETIIEKEKYIEERRNLYVNKINEHSKVEEKMNTSEIQALTTMYEITMQYKDNSTMQDLKEKIEQKLYQYLNINVTKKEKEDEEEFE